jgi:hypothetical protein
MLGLFPILAGCVRAGFDPWVDRSRGDGSATDGRGLDRGGADTPRTEAAAPAGDGKTRTEGAPDSARPDLGPANRHALAFNGSANVDLGAMLYSTPPNALTVELWIKVATLPAVGDFAHLVYNGRHGQWTFTLTQAQLEAGPSIGASWYRASVATASITGLVGSWHHLAMTWSQTSQTAELFVDGGSRGTRTTASGGLTNLTQGYRPTIGSYCTLGNTYERFFVGLIDEVRVWNVVRTPQQIQQAKDGVLTGSEPGLIGYWRFEGGSGGKAFDSSSGGHDGTINAATWSTDTPF